jgi:hypothetical protein
LRGLAAGTTTMNALGIRLPTVTASLTSPTVSVSGALCGAVTTKKSLGLPTPSPAAFSRASQ